MTLSEIAKALNRSIVYFSGLQRRFELPLLEGAAYPAAYFAFFRKIVYLRTLGIPEADLVDLWKIEKHLIQLLHHDAIGSPTWYLDENTQTGHFERRLLLTHHDLGPEFECHMLQPSLDFAQSQTLFTHRETGDDVLPVLERYLESVARIRATAEGESLLLRNALHWFPRLRANSPGVEISAGNGRGRSPRVPTAMG